MKKKTFFIMLVTFACSSLTTAVETRSYLLGDIDDFAYNGSGSVDDVYVAPEWLAWSEALAASYSPSHIIDDFDTIAVNHLMPFTFEYQLSGNEEIINATLTVSLQAVGILAYNDEVYIDSNSANYSFANLLGWSPSDTPQYDTLELNLSNVLGNNLLSTLQDGRLNILVQDDCAIDYAELNLEVIPEPATFLLLSLGAAMLRYKRNSRYYRTVFCCKISKSGL